MTSKGAGSSDTVFLIGIVIFLILAWVVVGANKSIFSNPFNLTTSNSSTGYSIYSPTDPTNTSSNSGASAVDNSPYAGEVYIEGGNAASAYEPYQEYIVLVGASSLAKPVDITGWSLTNARGTRVYQVGSSVQRFPSNKVVIPKAVAIFDPDGSATPQPVMLAANQNADLVTGSITQNGIPLPSFRDNECLGYVSQDPQAGFTIYPTPYAYYCPVPTSESGYNTLDQSCKNFVSNLYSCTTPNFNTSVYVSGDPAAGYVNGVGGLSDSCKAYVAAHYSYNGCVATHVGDKTFLQNSWHIYLGQKTELWADQDETITLFDQNNKVVATYSY